MSKSLQTSSMADNTYIAWAVYTGPAKVIPLWTDSSWIAGEWTGVNGNSRTLEEQVTNDIKGRIECAINAFLFARSKLCDQQKVSATHFFVIPEFYFHSKQGPYPKLKINGLFPYEYIRETMQQKLKSIPLLPQEVWIFCAGSIMTCNEPDINRLLASEEVGERLKTLNSAMGNLAAANGYQSVTDWGRGEPYIKAKSYLKPVQPLSIHEQAIDDLMIGYRADPLCIVRNRGLIFLLKQGYAECYGYEKQSESTVDLTMGKLVCENAAQEREGCHLELGGMVTEWMAGYPSISIIQGDKQCPKTPIAARMSIIDAPQTSILLEMGVEICLDHRLQRLRRTAAMTVECGANRDNPPLNIELIPSGGMQILDYSVAAGAGGVIFNSDGCDPILDVYTKEGKKIKEGSDQFKQITCGVYASSAQTMVQLEKPYYSHSQLSFRFGDNEIEGYNNALGLKNIQGPTFDPKTKTNVTLDAYPLAKRIPPELGPTYLPLFAAGYGEEHFYMK